MGRVRCPIGLVALAAVLTIAGNGSAQVTGRIVGPGATRLELAVSPLADAGGGKEAGERFAEVLSRNLTLSGYFRVLDAKAYLEGPTPLEVGQINFANWSVIGAKALVKGSVSQNAGSLVIEARLYDVAQH